MLADAGSYWIRLADAGLLAHAGCCWLSGLLVSGLVLGFRGCNLWTHAVRERVLMAWFGFGHMEDYNSESSFPNE